MRVVVLGAGVIGVATAWFLQEAGCTVTVIDRQPAPARETSFANGGQISVSHAEPWANPAVFSRLLGWLGREEAPLLWRLRADAAQWSWGLRFLRECSAARAHGNTLALIRLGLFSRTLLGQLRERLGIEYDFQGRGILHIYSQAREFDHACRQAELMRQHGLDRVPLSPPECLALEPALAHARNIAGGTYTAADESGDARRFTEALAARAAAAGVAFRFEAVVAGLRSDLGAVTGAVLDSGEEVAADQVVVALGSETPLLLRRLGWGVPIYPAKGYSVTFALSDGVDAPQVSLTDDEQRIVMSRLGGRLRVAGTAEFTGYDRSINVGRCGAIRRRALEWFPALAGCHDIEYWAGLRPSTPGNVPLIGPAPVPGLWINSGHGTLGWTLACGSARLLCDLMTGHRPDIDPAPYRPA